MRNHQQQNRTAPAHGGQSGFSLVELIIVVAIIAVLAAIGIPVYSGHIKAVRESKMIAHLGNVGAAAATFRTTMGKGRFPTDDELRTKLPGQLSPLVSPFDFPASPQEGWVYQQGQAPTATSFCVIAYPEGKPPSLANKVFYVVFEDGVVRKTTSGAACDRTSQPVPR